MKQVKTGIAGLDSLLGGGLAEGSTTMLIGPVGTLKSYVGQQFIYEGLRGRQPCVYISTVQDLNSMLDQTKLNFGWDLKPYVKDGLLRFVDLHTPWATEWFPGQNQPLSMEKIMKMIYEAEKGTGGGRELFHNFSPLLNFVEDDRIVLRMLHVMKARARKRGATTLYIVDEGAQDKQLEENMKSLCDYVLTTDISGKDRRIRVLSALTKHGLEWYKLSLTDKGVEVAVIL